MKLPDDVERDAREQASASNLLWGLFLAAVFLGGLIAAFAKGWQGY